MQDERIIKMTAVFQEKERQLQGALAEVCNLKGDMAVREAVISDLQGQIAAMKKENESLHESAADKVIAKEAKAEKPKGQSRHGR